MNFKDLMVISDLDGTLIDRNFTVSERNRRAIERFQQGGGRFAVATGRSLLSGARYFAAAKPNSPSVILNGTVIYDFQQKKILWSMPLCLSEAKECVQRIHERFPFAGIEVYDAENIGLIHRNERISRHLSREGIHSFLSDVFDGRPLCKALIADDAGVIQDIIAYTKTFEHSKIRFVPSGPEYLEMLPTGADKGNALKRIMQLCGADECQVFAIGDYYNDAELLQAAGFSAMPQNAPDDLKRKADLIVCSCDDGAVADLIEYIEQK
ncbi:MAG TPA: Cof-type HAD-IIB family hydrolase [Caproiciproducens sp.]|nr:Cof-type HAD-IIB family hydrolase [Caproiciproducens sp.]